MVVPAIEPLMPKLASAPSVLAVSSRVSPYSAATGAVYFIASPRSVSVWAELLAVAVITSATRPIWSASRENERSVPAAMFDASASSVPVARARSSTPAMAASICLGEKPARPSSSMPAATWAAENDVVRPSILAFSVSRSNSLPVAPITACTARIWSSKPAKTFVASANGAAAVIPNVSIRRPMFLSFSPNARTFASARRNPRTSRVSSANSSTNARPARIAVDDTVIKGPQVTSEGSV